MIGPKQKIKANMTMKAFIIHLAIQMFFLNADVKSNCFVWKLYTKVWSENLTRFCFGTPFQQNFPLSLICLTTFKNRDRKPFKHANLIWLCQVHKVPTIYLVILKTKNKYAIWIQANFISSSLIKCLTWNFFVRLNTSLQSILHNNCP